MRKPQEPQYVQDAGDMHGDVSHTGQLAFSRKLLVMICDIEAQSFYRALGQYVQSYKLSCETTRPCPSLAFVAARQLNLYVRSAYVRDAEHMNRRT